MRVEAAPEMLDLDLGAAAQKALKGAKKSGPKRMFEFLEASGPNKKDADKPSDKAQHAYSHGFQWNFEDHKDKSLAYVEHMDFGPHVDPNMELHRYVFDNERKEAAYDPIAFDSQFLRYAQILDTDYLNYMVVYQCLETAHYFNKETHEKMTGEEAWKEVERTKMDFTQRPYVNYTFSDNIEVKPLFYSNAKILWRPEHLESPQEVERMQRQEAGYADR